jgi:GDP/UDP-N,N'-diacetylbacillosamine 2-epimerase (hydrolysing)
MIQKRKILHVTGTRAEFGLMESTLQLVNACDALQLGIIVTGTHLSEKFGWTVREIEDSGLPIAAKISTDVDQRTMYAMSRSVGQAIVGISEVIEREKPDLLTVIGDRGEMLAGATAALHMGTPVVHLHGGERSGTIDESIRHAITKLSHWHFVATEGAKERVIRLGERAECVWVTGAPSLDDVAKLREIPRHVVDTALGISASDRFAIVLFHSVVQEIESAGKQAGQLIDALRAELVTNDILTIWLAPNSDAGSVAIADEVARCATFNRGFIRTVNHLRRDEFIGALNHAELLIGNSSAGIIESASVGVPVVNIGSRQQGRERNGNTHDCGYGTLEIRHAIRSALDHGHYPIENRYGRGDSGRRIVDLLRSLPNDRQVLNKLITY